MLRTNRSGARSSIDGLSFNMVIAVGGRTVDRIPNRRTSSANVAVANTSITTISAPARKPNTTL